MVALTLVVLLLLLVLLLVSLAALLLPPWTPPPRRILGPGLTALRPRPWNYPRRSHGLG